jgi:hypothetical protein
MNVEVGCSTSFNIYDSLFSVQYSINTNKAFEPLL